MQTEKIDESAGVRAGTPGLAPEVGLGMLLRNADNAFNRVLRTKLAEHGITFGQFQHLRQLWDEEGLNQVELSRRIGIEKASSTSVIESLLQKELIRRVRDDEDKRKIRVFLTAKGAALRDKLWPCAIETNRLAYSALSEHERQTLFKLLTRVTETLGRASTP